MGLSTLIKDTLYGDQVVSLCSKRDIHVLVSPVSVVIYEETCQYRFNLHNKQNHIESTARGFVNMHNINTQV